MSDLHAATTPEYVKVLTTMSSMSYSGEDSGNHSLVQNKHYAFISKGGRDCLEISLRDAYFRYRVHCKAAGQTPLYSGEIAFMHAVKDSPAFIKSGSGDGLPMPGVYTFDNDELARLGVDVFKSSR
jgi:hypothetical protein